MRRKSVGIVAVVCTALLVGATGSMAGTLQKAGTSLEAYADTDESIVFGEVGSKKPRCVFKRILVAFDSAGNKIGKDLAKKNGKYEIDASEASATPVDGKVIAKRKVFRNKQDKPTLVCKAKKRMIKDATPGILPPLPV